VIFGLLKGPVRLPIHAFFGLIKGNEEV